MRFFENKFEDFSDAVNLIEKNDQWIQIVKNLMQRTWKEFKPQRKNCDGSLYVGCIGVGYAFHRLSQKSIYGSQNTEFLTMSSEYADVALEYTKSRSRDPEPAFLLGNAGVYLTCSFIYDATGKKELCDEMKRKYISLSNQCLVDDYLPHGCDELLVGRAGYLCGCYAMRHKFGKEVIPDDVVILLQKAIIKSGRKYARDHKSPCPLMYAYHGTEYLGAAHGLSSILQMLLCSPEYIMSDKSIEKDVKDSVDFMLHIMQPNGNIAPATDEVFESRHRPESEELIHWCHGAPGVIYLFAKSFLFWKEEKYLNACLKCGEVTWQKGLLKKGPGICHGVAGSGYVFLLLYRLTNDKKHLYRAHKFAEFLISDEFKKAKTPDSPYSLYEGLAGTILFLDDLMQPEMSEFPFFNIFD